MINLQGHDQQVLGDDQRHRRGLREGPGTDTGCDDRTKAAKLGSHAVLDAREGWQEVSWVDGWMMRTKLERFAIVLRVYCGAAGESRLLRLGSFKSIVLRLFKAASECRNRN